MPDREAQDNARGDEECQHQPEADSGTSRTPLVLGAGLPTCPLQPHVVPHGLVIHERGIVCLGVTYLVCHTGSVGALHPSRDAPYCAGMVFSGNDNQGDSLLERGLLGIGDRLGLLAGLVLAVSAFTGWYAGDPGQRVRVSVTGWDTGLAGKAVFVIGVAILLVVVLREIGIELPASIPQSLLTIALGAVATILILVRVISIPDDFFWAGRSVGIWISLTAAIGVVVAGLLQASEEL